MILKIKNLEYSHLLKINFFDMRARGFIPYIHAHRSDAMFDLSIKGVKFYNAESDERSVKYALYSYNMDLAPFTLYISYGREIEVFKEV